MSSHLGLDRPAQDFGVRAFSISQEVREKFSEIAEVSVMDCRWSGSIFPTTIAQRATGNFADHATKMVSGIDNFDRHGVVTNL